MVSEIPQNYHRFALLDSPKMDNLMTPVNRQQKPYKPTSILGQVAGCV